MEGDTSLSEPAHRSSSVAANRSRHRARGGDKGHPDEHGDDDDGENNAEDGFDNWFRTDEATYRGKHDGTPRDRAVQHDILPPRSPRRARSRGRKYHRKHASIGCRNSRRLSTLRAGSGVAAAARQQADRYRTEIVPSAGALPQLAQATPIAFATIALALASYNLKLGAMRGLQPLRFRVFHKINSSSHGRLRWVVHYVRCHCTRAKRNTRGFWNLLSSHLKSLIGIAWRLASV